MESKIEIKKPDFSPSFLKALGSSLYKGCHTKITYMKDKTGKRDLILGEGFCNGRIIGKIYFEKIKSNYKMLNKLIIESDLNPYELIVSEVIAHLSLNSKAKYLTF